ncbi:Pyridine nucleotide-disulfide oxidoreductase family protein [Sphingomonas paucimobilis]|nr:Pyridine nucleotide-disulfide oxidoreductase family protein [Sphingomonas paucimobilis]
MRHDVIIIGGGFAGLAAATYLARARRSVRVLDTGKPRNRFAEASHGFLGQDGSNPVEILATARTQLQAYDTVELTGARANEARAIGEGFAVTLASGEEITARKLILAFGLRDELPVLPGLQERWGKTVLHCPYCHGFEFSDKPLGVLYRTPMSIHQAQLITEWGPTTLYLNGAELAEDEAAALHTRGVRIEPVPVLGLAGEGTELSAVELADGRSSAVSALYIAPRSCLNSPVAEQLGARIDEGPMGPIIHTDGDKMTSVPGLYAAGDLARALHSVSWAVADGVTAGTSAHRALVFG